MPPIAADSSALTDEEPIDDEDLGDPGIPDESHPTYGPPHQLAARHPDEVERERADTEWHKAHERPLKVLRARGRRWTAAVVPDDARPTWAERAHLEHVERGATPCATVLRGLANDGIARSPWLLFTCDPDRIASPIAEALALLEAENNAAADRALAAAATDAERKRAARDRSHARSNAALALALAVRSWEPDEFAAGVPIRYEGTVRVSHVPTPRSLEIAAADLNGHRDAVRRLKDSLLMLGGEDKPSDDSWEALIEAKERAQHAPRAVVARQIERLERRIVTDAAWLEATQRRADLSPRVLAAIEDGSRQPQLEQAWREARQRRWLPVERRLRADPAAGWDEHRLAALVLAQGWFVDLVPRLRRRYGGRPTFDTLRALMRKTREDRSPPVSKKRSTRRAP